MNLSNPDLIIALRELGYDVKSHSSTVDASIVGLLISHISKKKISPSDAVASKPIPKATPGSKSTVKPSAPVVSELPPPVTKPRVLGRYKKVTAEDPALAETAQEIKVEKIIKADESAVTEKTVKPEDKVSAGPVIQSQPQDKSVADEASLDQQKATPAITVKSPTQDVEILGDNSLKVSDNEAQPADNHGQTQPSEEDTGKAIASSLVNKTTLKPNTPIVPFRVASPSLKATPPRTTKSFKHHQSDSKSHTKKHEDKASKTSVVEDLPKVVHLVQPLTVFELAEKLNISETEIIKNLFAKGVMRTVNQLIETELAQEIARELEFEVLTELPKSSEENTPLTQEEELAVLEENENLLVRPPVVTIMGHVDHGKTSLLDAIRQTKFQVVDSEAGGITQHIGAYHVEVPHEDGSIRQIVFLDTPGHEAFTAMRARGAKATDIAILVVAADDGIMPQTIEAIDHAKAAKVPIIVAINKIDAPGADPDRILSQLMQHNLVPEAYGGDTVTVNVSAKKRIGLDELLEMILLVADVAQLKANPDKPARGVIIEAELSRGRGAVATALVENGTLREGDYIVAGTKSGRVRALFDDMGTRVKAAGPSMPVAVLGLDDVPLAGDKFEVVGDAQALKFLVEKRKELSGERKSNQVTLESFHDLLTKGEIKELNVIVKADVQGTAEAIADSVRKLSTSQVQARVLRIGSGDISENDVNLASSSSAIIIGFNVHADQNAARISEQLGVDIREYDIIYKITDDIAAAIEGLIKPVKELVQIGEAEVRQLFKSGKNVVIAGCYVLNGKIQRNCQVKVERQKNIVFEGKLDNLKRFKDDAKEVASGFECGISFEKFNDLQEGDIIKAFVLQDVKK